ncbi:MAG: preprotein translocase subunit YajC [Actinomycetota bacterium]
MNPLAIGWLVLMAAAFYLLLWRPQQRRMAAVRALQSALREGDEVMTTSGIYGRIVDLRDDELTLEIATGTVIRLARGAIGSRIGNDEDAESE